jgi:hypothetical protein
MQIAGDTKYEIRSDRYGRILVSLLYRLPYLHRTKIVCFLLLFSDFILDIQTSIHIPEVRNSSQLKKRTWQVPMARWWLYLCRQHCV